MEQYVPIEIVGRGSFGAAHLCTRLSDGRRFVMKRVLLEQTSVKDLADAENEVKVLSMLAHPNVIAYQDSFHSNGVFHIVMEYASGGTLQQFIARHDGSCLPQQDVLHLFCQVLLALHHIHSRNILHRDLSTANIFLTSSSPPVVKVGDFGISKVLSSRSIASTVVGTFYYMSPELCQGKQYDEKSDIWALGCVLYELVTLRKAFHAPTLAAVVTNIMQGVYEPVKDPQYDGSLLELLGAMLNCDPAYRPTAKQIMAQSLVVPTLFGLYVDLGAALTFWK